MFPSVTSLASSNATFALLLAISGALVGCTPASSKVEKPSDAREVLDAIQGANVSQSKQQKSDSGEFDFSKKEGLDTVNREPNSSSTSAAISDSETLAGFASKESSRRDSAPILDASAAKDPVIAKRAVEDDPSEPWIKGDDIPMTIWELTFTGERPVGFSTRKFLPRLGSTADSIQVELESSIRVATQNGSEIQRLTLVTHEKRNGELISIEGSLQIGQILNKFSGIVEDSVLKLETRTKDDLSRARIPWMSDYRGPFAIEQSLRRKPLAVGELRVLRQLDPMLGRLVETQIESVRLERSPTMLAGSKELNKTSVFARDGEMAIASTLWTDERGDILKTSFAEKDLRVFRVDEKTMQDASRLLNLHSAPSELFAWELKTEDRDGLIQRIESAPSIKFKIRSTREDPFLTVSRKSPQSIESLDARTANVTTYRSTDGLDAQKGMELETKDSPKASEETEWGSFNSRNWKSFVESLWGGRSPSVLQPRDKAIVLRDALRGIWTVTPFDQQVRRLDVLQRAKKSNSIEQALVLANVYRTVGIPSRLAIGYHIDTSADVASWNLDAWVEYFDGNHWIAIDPRERFTEASPGRVKVRESYFEDSRLLEDIYEVAQWKEATTIEILP